MARVGRETGLAQRLSVIHLVQMSDDPQLFPPLSMRLREATRLRHEMVDGRVMASDAFRDLARYQGFLRANAGFLLAARAAYAHPDLQALIPDLASRDRSEAALADLADFGLQPIPATAAGLEHRARATGWLYVAEGATLGGAVLSRMAEKMGLSGSWGARHLAAAPSEASLGPAMRWRETRAAIDQWRADEAQIALAIAAANDAFALFSDLLGQALPEP